MRKRKGEGLTCLNGRRVRLPTDAEWAWACRVGTSNPPLPEKHADQYSGEPYPSRIALPVKSKRPNAWGFYDMASSWWEFCADVGFYNPRTSQVDPLYRGNHNPKRRHTHRGRGLTAHNHSAATLEFIPGLPEKYYTGLKFRVAVDAKPAVTSQHRQVSPRTEKAHGVDKGCKRR